MSIPVLVKENLHAVLGDRKALYWMLGVLGTGIFFILATWPSGSLFDFVLLEKGPGTYSAVTASMSVLLVAASLSFALDRGSFSSAHAFVRWARFTPVSPISFFLGRVVYHALHTISLVVWTAPFFFVAAKMSLVQGSMVFAHLGFLSFLLFSIRVMAESFRRLDGPNDQITLVFAAIAVYAYIGISTTVFPLWSPVSAILAFNQFEQTLFSEVSFSILLARVLSIHVLGILLGSTVALIRLRRRARLERSA